MVSSILSREEGEWIKVSNKKDHRKRVKWDTVSRSEWKGDKDTTTILFTVFPDHMTAKDLFKHFEEFIVIGEVVIPPKRGKRDMRYRFVRFFDVTNVRRLVLHMDNLWLERRKPFSNIPRFQCVVEEMFPMVKGRGYSLDY